MKLTPIANSIILESYIRLILETASTESKTVQSDLFTLGKELKADGDDITDEEVQAAMLSAIVDADGDIDKVDVSDVDAIKTEIKESRTYLAESGVLHAIEGVGTVLGNAAFIHTTVDAMYKAGIKNVDEATFKQKITAIVNKIKKVTGFPAKVMEKAFSWIAKKLGFGKLGQQIAGIAGTIVATVLLLALAIYFFPSIKSVILLICSITGMIGKTAEIYHLIKKLIATLKSKESEIASK